MPAEDYIRDILPQHRNSDSVIVFGLCPAANNRKFKTSTLVRLAEWMDGAGFSDFTFDNVIEHHTPRPILSMVEAGRLSKATGYRRVVALGKFASDALTKQGIEHLRIEHPSGLNRNLNDPLVVQQQIEALKEYLSS